MREAKIPVTIGFSTTKTLAKLVTEQCKAKGLQTDLCYDRDELYDLLQKLSIKELWGIGRRLTKKLYQCGVYTIADYYDRDKAWIRSNYGVTGERTWSELHGISCIELDHIDRRLQDSISETRTFPLDVDDIDYLRSRIAIYASECARRLRRMNGKTHKITVFLRGNPFRADGYREANTEASCIIERATNDSVVLVKCATELLRSIFNPNHRYKRGGVILNDIVPAESVLPSLFDYVEGNFSKDSDNLCSDYQRSNLMVAIDELNKIPGNPSIKLASLITQGQVGHNDGYSSSFQAPKK